MVATDVNPRALAFASLNAALNGLDNVETRLGSLFAPVAGDTFDLITCNAPYVISPETKWQYRDGGLPADEFSARVVTGAAEALADGGYATLLVSWLAESEDEPDGRVLRVARWKRVRRLGARITGADPLEHAATWNDHLVEDHDALGEALDTWTAYFRELGVGWITEGAVLLHRRMAGRRHGPRVDPVSADELEHAGSADRARLRGAGVPRGARDGEDELLDDAARARRGVAARGRGSTRTTGAGDAAPARRGHVPRLECPPAVAEALAVARRRDHAARGDRPRRPAAARRDVVVRAEAIDALPTCSSSGSSRSAVTLDDG